MIKMAINVIGDTDYETGTEEPSVGGYDLSGYIIFGGSDGADVAGNTNITMTGGAVSSHSRRLR